MTAKEKVQSLIASANETTGEDDETLTDAVGTLIDGYGQGGAEITPLSVTENGTYTAPSGIAYSPVTVNVSAVVTFTGDSVGISEGTYQGIDHFITSAIGSQSFQNRYGIPHITCDLTNFETVNMYRAFYAVSSDESLKKITFIGIPAITNAQYAFRFRKGLKTIEGTLDLSSATNIADLFHSCSALEDVRFAPNSAKTSWRPFSTSSNVALTDDSFVSMANALDPTVAGTLTFYAYDNYKNILGNVVNGLFVKNASGTTTVGDFITNTKGWTVAS